MSGKSLLQVWVPSVVVLSTLALLCTEVRAEEPKGAGHPSPPVAGSLEKIRSVVECYVAHRKSLNQFRCTYRVYSVDRVTREDMELWTTQAKLPDRSRWRPLWECLWIVQPQGSFADSRWIGARKGSDSFTLSKKKGVGEGPMRLRRITELAWNGWWATRFDDDDELTVQPVAERRELIDRILGPRPWDPPTSLGLMGDREVMNPIIRWSAKLQGGESDLRYLGEETVRGFRCAVIQEGSEEKAWLDRLWLALAAGCSPIEEDYSYSGNRVIARCLDLREVAPGRWFPFLSAKIDAVRVRGTPGAIIIEVEDFEWGYVANPEEMALRFRGPVHVTSIRDYKVQFGYVDVRKVEPEQLPWVAATVWTSMTPPPVREKSRPRSMAVLAAGAALVLLILCLSGLLARRAVRGRHEGSSA